MVTLRRDANVSLTQRLLQDTVRIPFRHIFMYPYNEVLSPVYNNQHLHYQYFCVEHSFTSLKIDFTIT